MGLHGFGCAGHQDRHCAIHSHGVSHVRLLAFLFLFSLLPYYLQWMPASTTDRATSFYVSNCSCSLLSLRFCHSFCWPRSAFRISIHHVRPMFDFVIFLILTSCLFFMLQCWRRTSCPKQPRNPQCIAVCIIFCRWTCWSCVIFISRCSSPLGLRWHLGIQPYVRLGNDFAGDL